MKLFVNGRNSLKVGDQTVVFTEGKPKAGESVSFFSRMGDFLGTKPIARGRVVGACKNEAGAPVTRTQSGKRKANAWRKLWRVEVTDIEE